MEEQNKTIEASEPVVEAVVAVAADTPVETKFNWLAFVQKNFLAVSILVAGVLISGSLIYSKGVGTGSGSAQIQPNGQANAKVADVKVDDDPVLGSKNAPVTIIEFSDYQCPFCRVFWKDSFSQLKKEYIDTGKVRFVYRDYPLSFHPMSEPTAQAAECADDQGKYWEFHDKVFGEEQKKGQGTVTYTVTDLKSWASQLGLNTSQFNQCLDSGKYKEEVAKDFADGQAAGVSGTPSFFINGKMVVGAQPFASFKTIIDEELKKK